METTPSNPMSGKTILVVDDEPDIVELISYNLKKEMFNVLTASNGAEALSVAKKQRPDAVVLDIMMPEMDGFEVCRAFRSDPTTASLPILFLTAKAGEIDEILGLELGADDYLQKPISPRLLVTRVKTHLRRAAQKIKTDVITAPEVLTVETLEINRQNYTVRIDGHESFFPKKEFELLAYLAGNRGKVFDREHLLRRIWGESIYVIDRTVDVHVSKVREKLGKYGAYIETVKGVGYRFKE